MSINLIQQYSDRDSKVWFADVVIQTSGLSLVISGTAYVPAMGKQNSYNLSATIPFDPPASGTEHHLIVIALDGTLVVDPAPNRTDIAAGIIFFDLPAGTTDLGNVDINQITHVQEG